MSIRKEIRRQIKKILMEETEYDEKYGFPIVKSTKSTGEAPSEEEYGEDLGDGKSRSGTVTFEGAKEPVNDSFLIRVLWEVIAGSGKRKGYQNLMKLDGGTVGVAHFASDGLGSLYDEMGNSVVKKYFSKYNPEITTVQSLKDATSMGYSRAGKPVYCRVKGETGKDPVPGSCWADMKWWKQGMYDFLRSGESEKIQNNAWLKTHGRPARDKALEYSKKDHPEWETRRGVAIACCLVNSGDVPLLNRYSKNGSRSPNETMEAYSKNRTEIIKNEKTGTETTKIKDIRARFIILNKLFPDPNFKPTLYSSHYKRSVGDLSGRGYFNQYKPPVETAKNKSGKSKKG
jgi:hypothetical protein